MVVKRFTFAILSPDEFLSIWLPSAIKILTAGTVQSANMRHRVKFCADWSNHCRHMIIFQFCKMTAFHHFGFFKCGNFNFRYSSESHCAPSCQISRWSVNPLPRYIHFRFFKMAAIRHLGFVKMEILTAVTVWMANMRHLPNFVPIGQSVAEIFLFFDFSRWRPSAILDF